MSTTAHGIDYPSSDDVPTDVRGIVKATADSVEAALVVVDNGLTKKFHGARVKQSAGQAVANNTLTALAWDTEDFDTNAFHDLVTNNSRLTVPAGMAGYYRLVAGLSYTAAFGAAGFSDIYLYKNGALTLDAFVYVPINGFGGVQIVSPPILLAAADYMEVKAKQTSTASKTSEASTYTYASIEWLGAA